MTNLTLNNGIKMPILGLGTYQLRSPIVETITEAALHFGYKLIDTAHVYRNETAIGQVLKKLNIARDDIFVTSKLGPSQQGTEGTQEAARSSLTNLQLDYLDLFLIHWPGASNMPTSDTRNSQLRSDSWKQLEELYKEGKFKAIGISNYTIRHLEELVRHCDVMPAVLQVEVHPYLTQTALREYCNEHKIHVQAYSSLGSAKGCQQLLHEPVVQQISKQVGRSVAQVLLRWAVDHGMSVIPKTTKEDRLKENMDIFDFSLTPEQMEMLDNLESKTHFCWNPDDII